ncbi:MAG: type IX secretion system sortase PorU [Bacteroidales bacterium]|nr:type IX secretion system sortase PorU [Bacteroidales bacterium]
MINKTIIFFLSLIIFPIYIYSGNNIYKRDIKWKGVQTVRISENNNVDFLYFDGAYTDVNSGSLPVYTERFKLNSSNVVINVLLKNEIFEEFSEKEINILKDLDCINTNIKITHSLAIERKVPYALITFIPIRKNPENGKFEKLVSFELELEITENTSNKISPNIRDYAENSVLSTGNWYKIRVQETGIYKIKYDDLSDMGIDVSSIDPRNIRIYGNGSGMLPESNSDFRYDDLQENAIQVIGEDDGNFDPDDYILFYGESPDKWWFNKLGLFEHTINLYSNYTYYFITTDLGEGKRIETQDLSSLQPTHYVSKFNDFAIHEKEEENLIKSGSKWYGERFDDILSYDFFFNFADIDASTEIVMKTCFVARSLLNSYFKIYINDELLDSVTVVSINIVSSTYAREKKRTTHFTSSDSLIKVTIKYEPTTEYSMGWLNYIKFDVLRHLRFSGNQMPFRYIHSINNGNVSRFILSNVSSSVKIWEITNPINVKKIDVVCNNNKIIFALPTDSLREFIAFDGTSFFSAEFVKKIENQNLHAEGSYDMIIVSHPDFIIPANSLAQIHNYYDDLTIFVVTPEIIYNEFSSGAKDVTAIRDFIKMFYDRAEPGEEPKYLLLFGDGSYDNKDRISNNTDFLPTYQSRESLNKASSHVVDDYFGLLDENEGFDSSGSLDIGIGRFPVQTIEQAQTAVDKVEHYINNNSVVMGDWQNNICFLADDEDGNLHFDQADELTEYIDTTYVNYNINKIYLDAYNQVSTPSGDRYPEVNNDINEQIEKGALIVNYTGHGGETGWSGERVLEVSDINTWTNYDKMPVFLTATCNFSRFDDPERTSAGELVFLNPNGGGIVLFTTTRLAYSQVNFTLNKKFCQNVFEKNNNKYHTMGDLIMLTKTPSNANLKNFILLGDPALNILLPEYNIITTSINGHDISSTDTVKALSKITVKGIIQDNYGNKISNFNGIIYPTVYDKAVKNTTQGNDANSTPADFFIQNKIIFKSKVNVINGEFLFTFIVPKDISYNYGYGKISYYAMNDEADAKGYFNNFIIGGYDDNAEPDNNGPSINLYLNDISFESGGITNKDPVLLAFISDSHGINTVGNGIGHDIIAVLDDEYENAIVLNDYYEPDIGSYQSGSVIYNYTDLNKGFHTLKLKAWDVYNNSSEAYIEFYVDEDAEIALSQVLNYPNPFKDNTIFSFKHNKPGDIFDIQLQIYTLTGSLLLTYNTNIETTGYKTEFFKWNGTDAHGNKIKQGVYFYKLYIESQSGMVSEQSQKLVIIR